MGWSHLQSNGGTFTSAASFGLAYTTANLSSGTKLIAITNPYQTTTTAVKDGAGNSFTKVAGIQCGGSNAQGELSVWAMDTPAGDVGTKPTITATYAASAAGGSMVLQEIPGLAAGNTLAAMINGTAATNSGTLTANGNATGGSYSSAAASEYLMAVYADSQQTATTAADPTGATAYTLDAKAQQANNITDTAPAYGNSTGGAESATFAVTGVSGSCYWATILVAFKLASVTVSRRIADMRVRVPAYGGDDVPDDGSYSR